MQRLADHPVTVGRAHGDQCPLRSGVVGEPTPAQRHLDADRLLDTTFERSALGGRTRDAPDVGRLVDVHDRLDHGLPPGAAAEVCEQRLTHGRR